MKPTKTAAPSRLGDLVLVWLLSRSDGDTRNQIRKELTPILEIWRSEPEFHKAIDEEIVALTQCGQIQPVRRASFVLTESGKEHLRSTLRLKSLPKETSKKIIKDRYLLICFAELLDTSAKPAVDNRQGSSPPIALPADDAAFAQLVLKAARASKTGRFGEDKVFVAHVIQQLEREGFALGDVEAFKARLVTVHRRGLLPLNRADLVEAMDPKDITASEIRYLTATFHFVRI